METGKLISDKEAVERYNLHNHDPFGRIGFANVLLFEGDLYIEGDLDYDWYEQQIGKLGVKTGGSLILIDGNLKVNGTISPGQDGMPFLFVNGNVECNIMLSFDELIFINGNANIKYLLNGHYNDGSIEITGTTDVPYLLNFNHAIKVKLTQDTITINYGDDRDDFFEYDFTVSDFEKILTPGIVNEKGRFDTKKFTELVVQGNSPFKEGVKSDRQIVQEQLDEIFKKTPPEKTISLDLCEMKLSSIPKHIFSLHNLKILMLSRNDIHKIPKEIGNLTNLEELYLDHCRLTELPDEIGQLKNLKVLDLSSNLQLDYLPEEIFTLKGLEYINLAYCEYSDFLSTDDLKKLKEIFPKAEIIT